MLIRRRISVLMMHSSSGTRRTRFGTVLIGERDFAHFKAHDRVCFVPKIFVQRCRISIWWSRWYYLTILLGRSVFRTFCVYITMSKSPTIGFCGSVVVFAHADEKQCLPTQFNSVHKKPYGQIHLIGIDIKIYNFSIQFHTHFLYIHTVFTDFWPTFSSSSTFFKQRIDNNKWQHCTGNRRTPPRWFWQSIVWLKSNGIAFPKR